jgi:hypothetical protein
LKEGVFGMDAGYAMMAPVDWMSEGALRKTMEVTTHPHTCTETHAVMEIYVYILSIYLLYIIHRGHT